MRSLWMSGATGLALGAALAVAPTAALLCTLSPHRPWANIGTAVLVAGLPGGLVGAIIGLVIGAVSSSKGR